MSRRTIFLVVMTLSLAACTAATDNSTTTTAPTTTSTTPATTTTTPAVTEATETTTTATTADSSVATTAGPVVTIIDIVLAGGTVDRVERFDVSLDGAVRLTVTGDVSDEIHLHGYDLHADVTPEAAAVLEFDAAIPGVFEIELEGSGVLIGELQVAP